MIVKGDTTIRVGSPYTSLLCAFAVCLDRKEILDDQSIKIAI